jgi:hypothetical protein
MLSWDPKLNGDPRTIRLSRELDCSRAQAIGHLIELFAWMVDYGPDGCLAGLDHAAVASAAGWTADPDSFLKALLRAGWCDRNGRLAEWQPIATAALARRRDQDHHVLSVKLFNNDPLRSAVKARDGDTCRLCQRKVSWRDRRSPNAATYTLLDPYGEVTQDNTVVAHKGCAARRPTLRLVPTPEGPTADTYRSEPTADTSRSLISPENAQRQIPAVLAAGDGRKTVDNGRYLPSEETADTYRSPITAELAERQIPAVGTVDTYRSTADTCRYLPLAEGAFAASLSSAAERQIPAVATPAPAPARALGSSSGVVVSTPPPISEKDVASPKTSSSGGGVPVSELARAGAGARKPPTTSPGGSGLRLSEVQRTKLIEQWQDTFPGGAAEVGSRLDAAFAHKSRHNWDDAWAYADSWLRGDAAKLPSAASKANGRARLPPQPSEFARFSGSGP